MPDLRKKARRKSHPANTAYPEKSLVIPTGVGAYATAQRRNLLSPAAHDAHVGTDAFVRPSGPEVSGRSPGNAGARSFACFSRRVSGGVIGPRDRALRFSDNVVPAASRPTLAKSKDGAPGSWCRILGVPTGQIFKNILAPTISVSLQLIPALVHLRLLFRWSIGQI